MLTQARSAGEGRGGEVPAQNGQIAAAAHAAFLTEADCRPPGAPAARQLVLLRTQRRSGAACRPAGAGNWRGADGLSSARHSAPRYGPQPHLAMMPAPLLAALALLLSLAAPAPVEPARQPSRVSLRGCRLAHAAGLVPATTSAAREARSGRHACRRRLPTPTVLPPCRLPPCTRARWLAPPPPDRTHPSPLPYCAAAPAGCGGR